MCASRWDLVLDFDFATDWRLDQWQPYSDRNPPHTLWAPLPPRYALKLHREIRRHAPLFEQAAARKATNRSPKSGASDGGSQRSSSLYRTASVGGRASGKIPGLRGRSADGAGGGGVSEVAFWPIDLPEDASESLKLLAAREASGQGDTRRKAAPSAGSALHPLASGSGSGSLGGSNLGRTSNSPLPGRRSAPASSAHSVLTLTVLSVAQGSDSDGDGSDDDGGDDGPNHQWLVVPNVELQGGDDDDADGPEDGTADGADGADAEAAKAGVSSGAWSVAAASSLSRAADGQNMRFFALRKAFFAVLASLLKGYREHLTTEERLRASADDHSTPATSAAPPPANTAPVSPQAAEEYDMEEVFDAVGFVAMREGRGGAGGERLHLQPFLALFLRQPIFENYLHARAAAARMDALDHAIYASRSRRANNAARAHGLRVQELGEAFKAKMGTHATSLWGPISWKRRAFELHLSSGTDPAAAPEASSPAASAEVTAAPPDGDERLSLVYFDVDPILPPLAASISALKLAERSSREDWVRQQRGAAEAELAQRKARARKGELVLLKGATVFQVIGRRRALPLFLLLSHTCYLSL